MKQQIQTWIGRLILAVLLVFGTGFGQVQATADHQDQSYTKTRYPIVLVHGMLGYNKLLGVLSYWNDIPANLERGGAKVYVVQLTPLAGPTTRGEELIRQLEDLQARYGYAKFNLIGHSQGGLTSRYVAGVRPDLVASVTTFGTPHQGSDVANGLLKLLPEGSLRRGLAVDFVNALGELESLLSNGGWRKQDALTTAHVLSSTYQQGFAAAYPAGRPTSDCGSGPELAANGIRYYSFGGAQPLTNALDPSDIVMGLGSLFFKGKANDGLVGRCSSHWGLVVRDDFPWNHMDEVNAYFGLRAAFSPDPAEIYRTQANRLQQLDL